MDRQLDIANGMVRSLSHSLTNWEYELLAPIYAALPNERR